MPRAVLVQNWYEEEEEDTRVLRFNRAHYNALVMDKR